MTDEGLIISDYLLTASTAAEITKLAEECSLSETTTLCFLTHQEGQPASVFKKVTSPARVNPLSNFVGVSRILISPTPEQAFEYSNERGWDKPSWEGLVMPQIGQIYEYQKVYPQYTSDE